MDAWFVSSLGTAALAGMVLVLPLLYLMQHMSQGAVGGGISSAIARALGGKRQEDADGLVLTALALNTAIGIICCAAMLIVGPRLYAVMGGTGPTLQAALAYSNVLFAGVVFMWTMNALASATRGSGNLMVPGAVICGGAVVHLFLSPCLIFGLGPFPELGIQGAAYALLLY